MRRPLAFVLLAPLLAVSPWASADGTIPDTPRGDAAKDDSTPEYLKAVEMQRKGQWREAQKAFRDLVVKYPNTVHRHDCEMRGGDNCYLGCVEIHKSGPSSRRIDVSVMGDGFQIDAKQQATEEKWARDCLDVLWSEYAYSEYKDYFNYYYVRLASKDEGVDDVLTPEQEKALAEKNKNRATKKTPKEFDTALDCKAAGPQHQVMADHDLVYQWLAYANLDAPGCGDDGLVIAFAKKGQLGMAELNNGLANCGPPSRSVTVHEFGHAFVGLYDEYANQPGPPTFPILAPNATSDLRNVPWQHFIDKKWKGIGAPVEGGATYKTGVWRPGPPCSMNSAGAGNGYCPPCREAAILRIYSFVDPIDKTSQDPFQEMKVAAGDASEIVVTPMQPAHHALDCQWFVDPVEDSEPGPVRPMDESTTDGLVGVSNGSHGAGPRIHGRDPAVYEFQSGQLSDLGRVEETRNEATKTKVTKFVFPTGKLPRGRYQVTCRVWDPCEYVLKDTMHLLEEKETFWVRVGKK